MVTRSEKGCVVVSADRIEPVPAFPVERVVDTNGAGDIFHGAYVYSAMARPDAPWEEHFAFARGASAHSIQRLGNEASLPTLGDIEEARRRFTEKAGPAPAEPARAGASAG